MDAQTSIENEGSSTLRRQIEQTQLDLGAKIGALEGEVRAVTSHAREAVREQIDAVRRVVDIRGHVARHPLLSVTLVLGAGVALGLKRRGSDDRGRGAPTTGFRGFLAPKVATLRAVLVSRALSFAAERLTERLIRARIGVQEGEQSE